MSGNTASTIRKKDLAGQKNTALGYKNLRFAHQADAGETGLTLSQLTVPSSMAAEGFTNPSASELAAASIFTYRKNLHITSSLRGLLIQDLSYRVNGNGSVSFIGFTADQDEIFDCILLNVAKTGLRLVDGRAISVEGTLAAGETDFNVGSLFQVNLYPNGQTGAIMVFEDGFVQSRNVGNAAANPSAEGNYQEIDNGTGYGSIIRFNSATAYDRTIKVVSTGVVIDKPSESHSQEIERLQGLIDTLTDTLAEVAGVSIEDLKSAATQPDLKAFGDAVLDLQTARVVSSATTLGRKRFQRILADTTGGAFTLTLPASPALGDRVLVVDLSGTFGSNNLTIGRNGSNILGVADDFLVDTSDAWVELIYTNSSRGWVVRG